MTKRILSLTLLAAMLWLPAPIRAQTGDPVASAVCPVPGQPLDPQLNLWLTELVKQHLPHRYDRDKDWGGQAMQDIADRGPANVVLLSGRFFTQVDRVALKTKLD